MVKPCCSASAISCALVTDLRLNFLARFGESKHRLPYGFPSCLRVRVVFRKRLKTIISFDKLIDSLTPLLNRGIVINGHLNISYSQGPEGRLWPDNRFLLAAAAATRSA